MAVHLLRMAVGIESVEHMAEVQSGRMTGGVAPNGHETKKGKLFTYTRNVPKRIDELVDGGSIYWVVKRYVRVRQNILGVERFTNRRGRPFCALELDPNRVLVLPRRHRAFQGWRYLAETDTPKDLGPRDQHLAEMPDEMAAELRELGLI